MDWIVIIAYAFTLTVICIFSLEQCYLALLYRKPNKTEATPGRLKNYPLVTVQLPVFNEKYVIRRLIDAVCRLEYPKEKLEIQVLDDSNDETLAYSKERIAHWQSFGIDIKLIRRPDRTGFKAGALQYGNERAKGEFIAIFDADFVPSGDFLMRTLIHFDERIGMVQTKWGHINQRYSLLTRLQAFGLDAHFSVEQSSRSNTGKFLNFNGTAGIWRKACIQEAGGWQHDTLTEDLDLSYRAQMKGWKFIYREEIVTPAELPVLVPAIKSQQYRWNKGAAETAKKNVGKLLRAKLSRSQKWHGVMHLLNSSVFIFLIIASLLSIPMLYVKARRPELALIFDIASIFIIGFLATAFFYWVATKSSQPNRSFKYYLFHFPVFITFSLGMSLHNAIAVTEGFLGIKSPFIRTPKFNIHSSADQWKNNQYVTRQVAPVTYFEGLLALYFTFGIAYGISIGDYGLLLFHLMLALGFGGVFFYSIRISGHA